MKKFYFTLVIVIYSLLLAAQGTPTGTSTEVGITEGALSVSLTGAANYNIPIDVPPGINGVVPQVALTYSSQAGNGLAGYGWNVSGVSVITRIPATKFHDNIIDGVDFDGFDRFALDGQRLIVKNGTSGVYGANATVYETESFSNIKITSYGVHPSGAAYGPLYFVVQHPDGSVAYYGNTTNSRTMNDYAITYWQNPQGVRVSYYYTLANNNLSIQSIKYGTLLTTTAINQITFSYKPRVRPEQAYIGGQLFKRTTILSQISVIGNGVAHRNYTLEYQPSSLGYEQLTKLTESTGDNSKSYNPTLFSYENSSESIQYNAPTTNLGVNEIDLNTAATVTGDFNGDGKMDFLLYPTTGTSSKTKYWIFDDITSGTPNEILHTVGKFESLFPASFLTGNTTNGFKISPKQGWNIIKTGSTSTTFSIYSRGTILTPIITEYTKTYAFPKLVVQHNIANCNPEGPGPVEPRPLSTDTDKSENQLDGINAIPPGTTVSPTTEYTVPKLFLTGDFNGDGLSDLIVVEKKINYTYKYCIGDVMAEDDRITSGGKCFFVNLDKRITSNFVNVAGNMTITEDSKYFVADFNGDGRSDVYVFDAGTLKIYTLNASNQLIMLPANTYSDVDINIDDPILLGDYNGDGKSDFLIPRGYGTDYARYISTGTTYTKTIVTYEIPYHNNTGFSTYHIIPNDLNNDGKTDLALIWTYRNDTEPSSGNYQKGFISIRLFKNMDTSFASDIFVETGLQTNIKALPIPIFLSSDRANKNLELSFISNNQIHRFQCQKNFNQDKLLRTITTGNGVKETITYCPLDPECEISGCESIYTPTNATENYPNIDVQTAPSILVVSKMEKESATDYSKQLYFYHAAVSSVEGLGFLGFRSIMKTNWYNDDFAVISNVSKFDISKKSVMSEDYKVLGFGFPSLLFNPSTYISKSTMSYEVEILPNKVHKIKNTGSEEFDGLNGTSKSKTNVFDIYNNATQSTTVIKQGTTVAQTSTSDVTYYNEPIGSTYFIGRPATKNVGVTIYPNNPDLINTTNTEEIYNYTNNLITQIKKKGYQTDYITEDNEFDTFGNVTKKTISVPGMPSRLTQYTYDTSGRFLSKSIDIESFATEFTYNSSTGVMLTEKNPFGFITLYEYDKWQRKTKVTDYLGKSERFIYSRNGEKTIITTINDDGSTNDQLFDDLGRTIKKAVKNINGDYAFVSSEYDIYGREIKTSQPYFGTTPSQWSEIEFDDYGREIKNTSYTGKVTTFAYAPLSVTVSDGIKAKTTTKDAIGNVVTVIDNPGGQVFYKYYANGNLKSTTFNGSTTTITQDGWGRKISLNDPSAGTYEYEYNGFGETIREKNPNGETKYYLDPVGKVSRKTIIGPSTNYDINYEYHPTTKLLTYFYSYVAGDEFATEYFYDSQNRLISSYESSSLGEYVFEKQYVYDDFGRILKEYSNATSLANSLSSGKWIRYSYKNGYKHQVIDDATGNVLRQTDDVNAKGQLITASYGNGIGQQTHTYDAYGFPNTINYRTISGAYSSPSPFMTLTTSFNAQRGTLNSRINSLFNNWTETFEYDNLDRLTRFTNSQGIQEEQNYNDDGTIRSNSIGDYAYAITNKPYQVSTITPNDPAVLAYYTNRKQEISYNAFKKPISIKEQGVENVDFAYNGSLTRAIMYYGDQAATKNARGYRKYYSSDGTMEIKRDIANNTVEFITYIDGDGYTAPIVLKSNGTVQNYFYLHRDNQGSILAITNSVGQVVEKRLFDAWGSLIKYGNSSGVTTVPTTANKLFLDRGYTGHEHLLGVGLINMNGRLYDPKIHRFLSPDNFVQDPYNTQNFNRYGYVLNNPLMYTDPSGEIIPFIIIGAFVVGAYFGGVAANGSYNPLDWNFSSPATWIGIVGGGTIGAVSFGVGSAVTAGVGGVIGIGGAAGGFISGFVGGLAGGFISGFGTSFLPGGTGNPFVNGLKAGLFGGLLAGTISGIVMGIKAPPGKNFWTGNDIRPKEVVIPKLNPSGLTTPTQTPIEVLSTPVPKNYAGPVADDSVPFEVLKQAPKTVADGIVDVSENPAFRAAISEEGKNIALGVRENLDEFARNINGTTWESWGSKDFAAEFLDVVTHPSNKIHFNLTGIDSPWSAVAQGAKGFQVGGFTNWELYQIYSNPALLQKTTFYLNGQVVPSPF